MITEKGLQGTAAGCKVEMKASSCAPPVRLVIQTYSSKQLNLRVVPATVRVSLGIFHAFGGIVHGPEVGRFLKVVRIHSGKGDAPPETSQRIDSAPGWTFARRLARACFPSCQRVCAGRGPLAVRCGHPS